MKTHTKEYLDEYLKQHWTIVKAREIIGDELFDEAHRFFRIIREGEFEVVIFVSRKAYLMHKISEKIGFNLGNAKVYTDRVLSPSYKRLFVGKRLAIVDDTVSTGEKLSGIYKQLTDCGHNGKLGEDLEMYVFAINVDNKNGRFDIKSRVSYHLRMSEEQLHNFSMSQARLVNAVGMVYFLEHPIYHADFIDEKTFETINSKVTNLCKNNEWAMTPYNIDTGYGEDIKQDGLRFKSFFVVPKNKKTPSMFPSLFEFIKYSYAKHEIRNEENREKEVYYSVNFVPLKSCYYTNSNFCEIFLKELTKINKDMNDFWNDQQPVGWSDESVAERLHRKVVFILSHCFGVEFFKSLNAENEENEELKLVTPNNRALMDDRFLSFIKTIKEENSVNQIYDALIKTKQICDDCVLPENLKNLYKKYNIPKSTKNLLEKLKAKKSKKNFDKFILTFLREIKIDDKNVLPRKLPIYQIMQIIGLKNMTSKLREAIMSKVETSMCSLNVSIYPVDDGVYWMFMSVSPGENSFSAIFKHIPPKFLNALKMFTLGIGSYAKMKRHINIFQNVFASELKDINLPELIKNNFPKEEDFYNIYLEDIRKDYDGIYNDNKLNVRAYKLGEQYS